MMLGPAPKLMILKSPQSTCHDRGLSSPGSLCNARSLNSPFTRAVALALMAMFGAVFVTVSRISSVVVYPSALVASTEIV